MKRWAFHSQMHFLTHKFRIHRELDCSQETVLQDRTIFEDAEIFAHNLYKQKMMTKAEYEKYFKAYGKIYPLGRAGEPEDVSELVSFLASGRASWMTGDVISVDGGGLAAG